VELHTEGFWTTELGHTVTRSLKTLKHNEVLGAACFDSRLILSSDFRYVSKAWILLHKSLPSRPNLTVFHKLEVRELVRNEIISNDALITAQIKYIFELWS